MHRMWTPLASLKPPNLSHVHGPEVFPTRGELDGTPWVIDPSAIEAGSPSARVVVHTTSPDGLLESGLWSCTAGRFRLTYGCDEFVHILDGEVTVHRGDRSETLRAGDAAYFRAGLETTWDVPRFVRKVWVMRYEDRTLLGRLAKRTSHLFRGAKAQLLAPRLRRRGYVYCRASIGPSGFVLAAAVSRIARVSTSTRRKVT